MSSLQIAKDILWRDVLKAIMAVPSTGAYKIVKELPDAGEAERSLGSAKDIYGYFHAMSAGGMIHPNDVNTFLVAMRDLESGSPDSMLNGLRAVSKVRYLTGARYEWVTFEVFASDGAVQGASSYLLVMRRARMMDLMDDLERMDMSSEIMDAFIKVLKVDIARDTFEVIKMSGIEAPLMPRDASLSAWLAAFAASHAIHPKDVDIFKNFADIRRIRGAFAESMEPLRCKYRRRADDGWHWVIMELVPTAHFSAESQTVMLYIKDIDDGRRASVPSSMRGRREFDAALERLIGSKRDITKSEGVGIVDTRLLLLPYIIEARGKEIGDMLTTDFYQKLMKRFCGGTCYRVADDEFLVLVEGIGRSTFIKTATECRTTLNRSTPPIAVIGWAWESYAAIDLRTPDEAEAMMKAERDEFILRYPSLVSAIYGASK